MNPRWLSLPSDPFPMPPNKLQVPSSLPSSQSPWGLPNSAQRSQCPGVAPCPPLPHGSETSFSECLALVPSARSVCAVPDLQERQLETLRTASTFDHMSSNAIESQENEKKGQVPSSPKKTRNVRNYVFMLVFVCKQPHLRHFTVEHTFSPSFRNGAITRASTRVSTRHRASTSLEFQQIACQNLFVQICGICMKCPDMRAICSVSQLFVCISLLRVWI